MTDPTTGTTTQNGGDAAVTPTTGTPGDADRNASEDKDAKIARLEAEKQQALAEKTNHEKVKAEKEALENQVRALSSQPPTTGVDPVTANIQAYYQELLYRATVLNEPAAQFQLAQIQAQQTQNLQAMKESALVGCGDARAEVEAVLQQNPQLDVQTARSIVEGQRAQKRLKDYETKDADDKRRAEEAGRAGNLGVTSITPAPAAALKNGLKLSDFQRQMAAFNQRIAGGDQSARAEALKLQGQIDTGAVVLVMNE